MSTRKKNINRKPVKKLCVNNAGFQEARKLTAKRSIVHNTNKINRKPVKKSSVNNAGFKSKKS